MHRPGRPEDLPPADVVGARWAAAAAVLFDPESAGYFGFWLTGEGLHHNDGGSSWAAMTSAGDGRAVLFGDDDAGRTRWLGRSIDLIAGAPEWLPYARLRRGLEGSEIGFIYWYEDGAWHRAPYPDDLKDDGLAAAMRKFADHAGAVELLESWLQENVPALFDEPIESACDRFLNIAEQRAVTLDAVRDFTQEIGWTDADVTEIYDIARRAGLTAET